MKPLYKLGISQKDFYFGERFYKKRFQETRKCVVGEIYYTESIDFNPEAMEKAYFEVLNRNDAFRMRLVKKRGKIRQTFEDAEIFPSPKRNYYDTDINSFLQQLKQINPPLIKMTDNHLTKGEIFVCKDGAGGLILWQHHICTDGYSMGVIFYQQLCEAYQNNLLGEKCSNNSKTYSIIDCYIDENKKKKKYFRKAFHWYLKEFNHHIFHYKIPIHTLMDEKDYHVETICLKSEEAKMFDDFTIQNGCSDTAVIIAAAAFVINDVSKAKRFLITSRSHGRATYIQKNTAGALLKNIPVFCDFVKPISIRDFLHDVYRMLLKGSMYSYFSFTEITLLFSSLLSLWSRSSLNDLSWFGVNNMRGYGEDKNMPLKMMDIEQKGTVFGVSLRIKNEGDDIMINFCYLEKIISQEKAKSLKKKFEASLNYIMNHTDSSISDCVSFIKDIN